MDTLRSCAAGPRSRIPSREVQRGYESLQIETRILDGESHLSGVSLSMSQGLGSLFRPR
jgi:hypothetical protein